MNEPQDRISINVVARSKAWAGRISKLEGAITTALAFSRSHGMRETWLWTINFRNGIETPPNAFRPLRQELRSFLAPRPLVMVGIIVPAAKDGARHDRQRHGHGLLFLPPGAEAHIEAAINARNTSVPRSCQIRRPDEDLGGVLGWVDYMAGRRNAGHGGSDVYLSQVARNTDYTAERREMRPIGEILENMLVTSGFGSAANRPTSYDQTNRNTTQADTAKTIAKVADAPDPLTGEIHDETVLLLGRDLLGFVTLSRPIFDQWTGGPLSPALRTAIKQAMRLRSVTSDTLAAFLGISQPHLQICLGGRRDPLGTPAAARLKLWLNTPPLLAPTHRHKPTRKRKAVPLPVQTLPLFQRM